MSQALEGVQIADFTQMMAGSWAAMKLGDMGAEVVKIEPIEGEIVRGVPLRGEEWDDEGPIYLSVNRNKKSLPLDLKSEEGRDLALEVVKDADILMENFRPTVLDQLGLSYEDVKEVNTEIVYVSVSGYGGEGPYETRPGQDLLVQSLSGIASITGRRDAPPTPSGTYAVDVITALNVLSHTLLALFHAERMGEGQKVNVNMLDSAIDAQCQEITTFLKSGDPEIQRSDAGIAHPFVQAPYGIYETADGHIAIDGGYEMVSTIGETFGLEGIVDYTSATETYHERDEIKLTIESYTKQQSTEELMDDLLGEGVWSAEVQDYEEVIEDPQVDYNDMIIEIDRPKTGTYKMTGFPGELSKTPLRVNHHPPLLGEHTEEILSSKGYGQKEINRLIKEGVTTNRSVSGDET
jgi:crotonobetainyl-CoA:carnitine CoA-transferase CaiB-like acyl-CoA transferase